MTKEDYAELAAQLAMMIAEDAPTVDLNNISHCIIEVVFQRTDGVNCSQPLTCHVRVGMGDMVRVARKLGAGK